MIVGVLAFLTLLVFVMYAVYVVHERQAEDAAEMGDESGVAIRNGEHEIRLTREEALAEVRRLEAKIDKLADRLLLRDDDGSPAYERVYQRLVTTQAARDGLAHALWGPEEWWA